MKPFLFSCIPLLAIFFVKFTSQHFNDGLILLGLNLVAMRLNKSVMRQVQLKFGSYYIKMKSNTEILYCPKFTVLFSISNNSRQHTSVITTGGHFKVQEGGLYPITPLPFLYISASLIRVKAFSISDSDLAKFQYF